jgi:hypothetical protein
MSTQSFFINRHSFLFLRKYFIILLLLLSVISTQSYSQQGKGLGSKPGYSCTLTGPASTCPGTSSIPYTATLEGYNGAVKYQWSLLNNTAGAMLYGNISGITNNKSVSINITPTSGNFIAGGHFNLRLIIFRGINADTCYINSHTTPGQTVSINASQNLQVFTQGNVLLRCPINNFDTPLAAFVTCGTTPYNIVWTSSGTGTFSPGNNILNPIYIPSQIDVELGIVTINVRVTDANGTIVNASFTIAYPVCLPTPINPIRASTTSSAEQPREKANDNMIYRPTGKNKFDLQPGDNITIYPNPSRGTFNILVKNAGPVDMTLVNKLGITIQKWNRVHSETVQLKGYKAGIYTLLIFDHTTQKQVSKKVVIQE